ncbi:hypothetical protein QR680_018734 [Steinernema hermaphroditum]|uniref:Fatty acid synthase n=1 Tax=Steinernema hermaphroditum TaxID=289476 RepID=A0AA39HIV5_9BILA|nr:hypothetical protein QR680_018734 [Steinernema hermaphroditum]
MDLRKSVSIIGRACRLPGCDSFDEFRDAVLVGRDLTEEIPPNRWLLDGVKLMYPSFRAGFIETVDLFDNKYFNISSEEALAMDPSQRVLLELTVEALDSAGLSLSSVALARTAVFVAQSDSSEYAEMIDEPSRFHTAGTHAALTAGRIASFLNSMRGAVTVETACSSALTALHMARKCLLEKECEYAIVAAANTVISDKHLQSLIQSHVVSSSGRSSVFDRSADGYVPSEAFAVFVLEVTGASRPSHGIVLSSAISSDGSTPRNPESQENLLKLCLKNSKKVDFVQTHGGDSIELGMLGKCIDGKFKFVSGKALLGHAGSVSGLVSILHSLVVMGTKTYPSQLHLNTTSVTPGTISLVNEEHSVRTCIVNSFGLGGSNACALIERATIGARAVRSGPRTLLLSANSPEALKRKCVQFIVFLDETNLPLDTVCHAASHVNYYLYRKAVYGKTRAQIQSSILDSDNPYVLAEKTTFTVTFHHTAYRSKHGYRSLYVKEPVFKQKVDEVLSVIAMYGRPHFKHRIFEGPTGNEDGLLYDLTISYAYFQMLHAYGLRDTVASAQGITFLNALAAMRYISVRQAVEYIVNQRSVKPLLLSLRNPDVLYRGESLSNFSVDEIAREMNSLSVISCTSQPLTIEGLEMDEDRCEWESFQMLLGQLFLHGINVRFPSHVSDRHPLPDLPAYPFERVAFWPKKASEVPLGEPLYSFQEIEDKLAEFELQYPEKRDFEAKLIEEFGLNEMDLGATDLPSLIFQKQKPERKVTTPEFEDTGLMIALLTVHIVMPGGDFVENLWDSVKVGRDMIAPMTRRRQRHFDIRPNSKVEGGFLENIEKFDNAFFKMTEDDVYQLSYEQRLILQGVEDAIEKAGSPDLQNSDIYLSVSGQVEHSTFLGKLARDFGIGGRAVVMDSGGTSLISCLEAAVVKMNLGATDYSIIVTSNLVLRPGESRQDHPKFGAFDVGSEDKELPQAEGVGVLILKKYTSLQKLTAVHAKAVLRFCVTKQGDPLETLIGLLTQVNLEVDYLEGHGDDKTADFVQADVANKCFHRVHLGSLKSNFGHSHIASGIPAFAKCTKVLAHDYFPAQLHLCLPYATARDGPGHATLPFIGYDKRALDAGVVSCDKNGTNAYTLLSCIPVIQENTAQNTGHAIMLVSARDPRSLKVVIDRTRNFIIETKEPLYDVSRALQTFKKHHQYRAYFIGKSHQEIAKKMKKPKLFRPKEPIQVHLFLGHLDREERFTAMIDMVTNLFNFGITKLPIVAAGRALIACAVAAQVLTLAEAIELRDLHKSGQMLTLMRTLRGITFTRAIVELRNPKGVLIDGFEPFIDGLIADRDYPVEMDSYVYVGDHSGLDQAFRVETERDFLDLLGRFYLSGADLNWNAFTVPFKRMNLPTYPYKMRSFWNHKEGQSFSYLKGHKKGNDIHLPEATLIHLALDSRPGALKNVEFKKPLIMTNETELNLAKLADYFSCEADTVAAVETIPIVFGEEIAKIQFYEELEKKGYSYKGAFKSVKGLKGNHVTLDRVRSPDLVLDGVLQALLYSIPQPKAVLRSIDHLCVYETFDKKTSYVAKFQFVEEGRTAVIANVVLEDDKGLPYLYAQGMRFDVLSDLLEDMTMWIKKELNLLTVSLSSTFTGLGFGADHRVRFCKRFNVPLSVLKDCNTIEKVLNYLNGEKPTVIPKKESSTGKIGIRAIACRLPGNVSDPVELWDYLKTGKNSSQRVPLSRIPTRNSLMKGEYGNPIEGANFIEADVAGFDHKFFKLSKSEAEKMDPQQRLLLECTHEVLERAHLGNLENVPVYIGFMGAEYPDLMANPKDVVSMLGSSACVVSGRINYVFGSSAESMTVDTACSSSLTALDLAVGAIKSGKASRALVGGVNLILTEKGLGQRANGKMLSEDGKSRSFDSQATGYGRADGCVVTMIEEIQPGIPYLAVIEETGVNHCGTGVSLTAPNGLAQEKLLRQMLGSRMDTVDVWEAHGTGTQLGDPIEANALGRIFRNRSITVASIKSNLGHSEAAAGLSGLLKMVLQLQHNYVPNMGHIELMSKNIKAECLNFPICGEEMEVSSGGVSSFGVSGTNAATVISKSKSRREPRSRQVQIQDVSIKKEDNHIAPDHFISIQDLTRTINRRLSRQEPRRRQSAFSRLSSQDQDNMSMVSPPPSRSSSVQNLKLRQVRCLSTVSQVSSRDYQERSKSIDELQSLQDHHEEFRSAQNLMRIEDHRDQVDDEEEPKVDHSRSCQDLMQYGKEKLSVWDQESRIFKPKFPYFGVVPVSAKNEKSLDLLLEEYRMRISESSDWLTEIARAAALKPVYEGYRAALVINEPRRTVEIFKANGETIPMFGFDLPTTVDLDYSIYYHVPLFKKHLDMELEHVEEIFQGKVKFDQDGLLRSWTSAFLATLSDLGLKNYSIHSGSESEQFPTFWFSLERLDFAELQLVVGQLFIQGISIKWDRIYDFTTPTVILPTYAFDRSALWFKKRPTNQEFEFLGQLIATENSTYKFENLITKARYRNLYDLASQMTCSFFIEILTEIGRYFFDSLNFEISKLSCDTVDMEDHFWITVEAHVYSDDSLSVQIFTENRIEPICEADITVIDTLREDRQLFNIRTTVAPSKIYKGLQFYQGINYSNSLQCLTEIDKISCSAIGISLPNPEYCIDPVLLEGAIQIGLCALDSSDYRQFVRLISRVYVYQNLHEKVLIHFCRDTGVIELLNERREIAVKIVLHETEDTVVLRRKDSAQKVSERMVNARVSMDSVTLQATIEKVQRAVADIMTQQIDAPTGQGFMEMGLDSMMLIDLINRLNSEFPEARINTNDLFNHPNIEELGKAIYKTIRTQQEDDLLAIGLSREALQLSQEVQVSPMDYGSDVPSEDRVQDTIDEVHRIVADIMVEDGEISKHQGFFELGLDSMMLIDFINRLNTVFPELRLNTNDLFNYPNIEELGKAIHQRAGNTVPKNYIQKPPEKIKKKESCDTIIDDRRLQKEVEDPRAKKFPLSSMKKSKSKKPLRIRIQEDSIDQPKLQYPKTPYSKTIVDHNAHQEVRRVLQDMVFDILGESAGLEPKIGFMDLELDSTMLVELLNRLNTVFPEAKLTTNSLFDYPDIESLAEAIAEITDHKSTRNSNLDMIYTVVPHVELFPENIELLKIESLNPLVFTEKPKADTEEIKIEIGPVHQDEAVPSGLKNLGNYLISRKTTSVWIDSTKSPFHGLLAGFLRSLAAEYPQKIKLNHDIRVHLIRTKIIHSCDQLNNRGTWLITGGASGIGRAMADWLLQRKYASRIIVTSRSKTGRDTVQVDVTETKDMERLLKEVGPELVGVIHSAGVLRDARFPKQTATSYRSVLQPKIEGLNLLISLCDKYAHNLEHFIVNSSIAALLGNIGQTGYSAANAYMDTVILERRKQGKPGTTINWGNWKQVGMAKDVNQLLEERGFTGITVEEGLAVLEYAIQAKPVQVVAARIDWVKVYEHRSDLRGIVLESDREEPLKNSSLSKTMDTNKPKEVDHSFGPAKIAFLLSGQGAQYSNMGRELYDTFKAYRDALDCCTSLFQFEIDLKKVMFDDHYRNLIHETVYVQPLIFCTSYALSQLWASCGLSPDIIIGHSVGEILGMVLAGMLSLEEGAELVSLRAKCMERIRGRGVMVAVHPTICKNYPNLEIVAKNSPNQVVVVGTKDDVQRLFDDGVNCKVVNSHYPFHSSLIHETDYQELLKFQAKFGPSTKILISNGQLLDEVDINHIVSHLRSPVLFEDSLKKAYALGAIVFLEVGPGTTLTTFAKQTLPKNCLIVNSISQRSSEMKNFNVSMKKLQSEGVTVSQRYGDSTDRFLEVSPSQDVEDLLGHVVDGLCVVPGAYQISLHLTHRKEKLPLEYGDLHFKNLLPITELQRMDSEALDEYFQCTKRRQEGLEKVDFPETNLLEHVDKDRFYTTLAQNGVEYRNRFQILARIRKYKDFVEATLHPTEKLYLVIEGAFQALSVAAFEQYSNRYFVPITVGRFAFDYGGLVPDPVGWSVRAKAEAMNDKFIEGFVQILNQGIVVGVLQRTVAVVTVKTTNHYEALKSPRFGRRNAITPTSSICPEYPEIEEVTVVGYSSTFSSDWNDLLLGKIPRDYLIDWQPDMFDAEFFGINPKEAACIDPQQKLLLELTYRALENAGIPKLPKDTGVYMGVSSSDFANKAYADIPEALGYLAPGTNPSSLAGRISYFYNLRGPSIVVDSACSSFFSALYTAIKDLKENTVSTALVGAVNLTLNEKTTQVLRNTGVLSPDTTCRAFDADANGYVRAEGAAVVVLQRRTSEGQAITGFSLKHQGRSAGLTVPYGLSQADVFKEAVEASGSPDFDFLECHGTGTVLGDSVELGQLTESCSLVGSVKSNLGHAEAAAGAASFITILENMKKGYRNPQGHFKLLNRGVSKSIIELPVIGTEKQIKKAVINCFGISGTNSTVVLEDRLPRDEPTVTQNVMSHLLVLSAKSERSLKMMIKEMNEFLENSCQDLHLLAKKLQLGRTHYKHRSTVVIDYRRHARFAYRSPPKKMNIVLDLSGFGEFHEDHIHELYHNCWLFKKIFQIIEATVPHLHEKEDFFEFIFKLTIAILLVNVGLNPVEIVGNDSIMKCLIGQESLKETLDKTMKVSCGEVPDLEIRRIDRSKVDFFKNLWNLKLSDWFGSNTERPSVQLNRLLARLFENGEDILWNQLFSDAGNLNEIAVPGYVFDRKRHWPFEDRLLSNVYQMVLVREDLGPEENTLEIGNIYDISEELHPVMKYGKGAKQKFTSFFEEDLFPYGPGTKSLNIQNVSLFAFKDQDNIANLAVSCAEQDVPMCLTLGQIPPAANVKLHIFISTVIPTGMVAFVKSLAAERPHLQYRVIHSDSFEDFKRELRYPMNESKVVHYRSGLRYVEKLVQKTVPLPQRMPKMRHLLITGGYSGIGQALIDLYRPDRVTVISRSNGVDCTDLQALLKAVESSGSIDTVIHAAGVVQNGLAQNLTANDYKKVLDVKVVGLRNLLEVARRHNTRRVMVISSAATVLGSFGQANYAYANKLMEEELKRSDLEVEKLIVNYGPWSGAGMLATKEATVIREQIEENGWDFLSIKEALDPLKEGLTDGQFMVFKPNWNRVLQRNTHLMNFLDTVADVKLPFRSEVEEEEPIRAQTTEEEKSQISTRNVKATVIKVIKEVSGYEDLNEEAGFMSLGIDSLMIESIRQKLQKILDVELAALHMYQYPNVAKLSEFIQSLRGKSSTQMNGNEALLDNDKRQIEFEASHIKDSTDIFRKGEEEHDDIAIIGISGAFSGAACIDDFWQNLLEGNECLTAEDSPDPDTVAAGGLIPDTDKFDYKFFNLSKTDADRLDPQIKQFVMHSWNVLESSGYMKKKDNFKIGVVAGAEPSDYCVANSRATHGSLVELYGRNQKDFVAQWTSHLLDLTGLSMGVYTACSTALTAIHKARDELLTNRVDLCLAGAVSLVLPENLGHDIDSSQPMATEPHCRPFNPLATGIVRGSAVGVVLLKKLSKALEDKDQLLGIIRSVHLNSDGREKSSFMAPNPTQQAECMLQALKEARVDPNEVGYIECHATGTKIGDSLELEAIKRVYKDRVPRLGSVKANIGHGFAGAGMASLAKSLKMFKTGLIPPQINLEKAERIGSLKSAFTSIHAFGIGGSNAVMLLEEPPTVTHTNGVEEEGQYRPVILPISAKSEESCLAYCRRLSQYLSDDMDLSKIAHTLISTRELFPYRTFVVARSISEAKAKLATVTQIYKSEDIPTESIAFFCCPQGVEYPEMVKDFDFNLSGRVQEDLVFLSSHIMKRLEDYGVHCGTIFGHSLGEYAALLQAEVLDGRAMKNLLSIRQDLQDSTVTADMVAIKNLSTALPENVECSAMLSDALKCYVGPPGSFDGLDTKALNFKKLKTTHGYHSSMMEPILPAFRQHLNETEFTAAKIPIISNCDGESLSTITPEYLVRHMREPVRLDLSINHLLQNNRIKVIVEVGPQGILSNLVAEKTDKVTVVPTVLSKKAYQANPDSNRFLEAIGQLWAHGATVFLKAESTGIDFNLPTYQFGPLICYSNRKSSQDQFRLYKRLLQYEMVTDGSKNSGNMHESCKNENQLIIRARSPDKQVLRPYPNSLQEDTVDRFGETEEIITKNNVVVKNGLVFTYGYEEFDDDPGYSIPSGAAVLLIGGNGFLGQAYRRYFEKNHPGVKIVSTDSQTLNVLNETQVFGVLTRIERLHTVVFLCGKVKNAQIKVKGIQNVLKALGHCTPIENLILASSLTSFVDVPGDEIYASGNIYLDTVACERQKNINTITSIQWPPLKGSKMMKSVEGNALKEVLETNSLNIKDLQYFIEATVGLSGVYAVSNHHPKKIRNHFRSKKAKPTINSTLEETSASRRDQVAEIWKKHLNVDKVEDSDNFFALGGHSLNGMSISHDLGITTNLLFEHPTFTDFLEATQIFRPAPTVAISKCDRLSKIPLTFAQENMIILDQIEEDKIKYCICYSIHFDEHLDLTVLQYALRGMMAKQPSLRSRFAIDSQEVLSLTETFLPITSSDEEITVSLDDPYEITVSGNTATFYNHHIITDGWSMTVFARELAELYQHFKNYTKNLPYIFPEITIADYAVFQRENFNAEKVGVLKKRLEGVPSTRITCSALDQNKRFGVRYLTVPEGLTKKIRDLSKTYSTSEYIITLSAFARLINRWNADINAKSITVGSPVAGRSRVETHNLIGYFLNNMVLNFSCEDLDRDPVTHVKKVVAEASEFEDVPYHLLEKRDVFHVYFNYRHDLDFPKIEIPGLRTSFTQKSINSAFELSFTIDITDYGTRITVEYNSGSFDEGDIEELLLDYQESLEHFEQKFKKMGQAEPTTFTEHPDCFHFKLVDEELVQLSLNLKEKYFLNHGELIRSDTVIPVDLPHPDFPKGALTVILAGAAYTTKRNKNTVTLDSLQCSRSFYPSFFYSTNTVYDIAYVIYTSGSTGKPKGVTVGRDNLLAFLAQNPVPSGRRVMHSVSPNFDVSCFNMFASIASRAKLVSGNEVRTVIEDTVALKGQILFLTSAMFNSLDKKSLDDLADLEELYVGGETPSSLNLRKCRSFGLNVTQIYGPSECTIWCKTSRHKNGRVIGRGYGNQTRFRELVIRGQCVARGYMGAHQGTFLSDAYRTPEDIALRRNPKAFNTKDLVRNRFGNLEYLGRTDDQIKIKGVRVTVSSLEAQLLRENPGILQVKILKLENENLAAFVVGNISTKPTGITVIPLKSLPMNVSGKIDKNELLKHVKSRADTAELQGTPKKLALIWQDLLPGITVASEETDLFDVGGHSLLLFTLKQKIFEDFGVSLPISTLGSCSRLKEMSEKISLFSKDVITAIKESSEATVGVYCIHAIGGTIYPYYVFSRMLPENCNVYGIDYDQDYPAKTLSELSQFYAKQIKSHQKPNEKLILLGHSLGGILCREITQILSHPFVIMLDSWTIGTSQLSAENVRAYLKSQFEVMPNCERLLEGSLKLTQMLKNHRFKETHTKIYLFKAQKLGQSALRDNITESTIRSYADNGWSTYSPRHPITVYLTPGDHETMLRPENLKDYVEIIMDIIERAA